MTFQPKPDDILLIDEIKYSVSEHPLAPGMPYGQEGRRAVVYQLISGKGKHSALKVFKARFRVPGMVSVAETLEPYAALEGMQACQRTVLTGSRHTELLRGNPELAYAVLMPWVEGPTWQEILLDSEKFTPERSLNVAREFSNLLMGLEEKRLAHCDLSGANLILQMGDKPALVDLEEMYGPGFLEPESLPAGSQGYAHKTGPRGLWSPTADRFAGAILLTEMLCWNDPVVRETAWGESYFAPKNMQVDNKRLDVLRSSLESLYGKRVIDLFDQAWRSDSLRDCPTFAEWAVALPVSVKIKEPVEGTQAGVKIQDEGDASALNKEAQLAVNEGELKKGLDLYQKAITLASPVLSREIEEQIRIIDQQIKDRYVVSEIQGKRQIFPGRLCQVCGKQILEGQEICPHCEGEQRVNEYLTKKDKIDATTTSPFKRYWTVWFGIASVVVTIIALILVNRDPYIVIEPTAETTMEGEFTVATEEDSDYTTVTYYQRAMTGEFAGTAVTMTGPFTDEDAVKFDASVAAFEEATGIDIQYEGSKEFEATITIRVEAGDAPDIIDFPQPGLLKTMVAKGAVVDVSTFLPQSSFDNYNQIWWDMATMAGPDGNITAGVWHRLHPKSQIWYPQEEFEAAGYAIPETWDEMVALADQIAADGDKPWCVGFESGAATGWAATDWVEDVMLRTTSLENYDKWTNGELKFSSPEVKNALEILEELWADEYVYGGSEAIVTTFFVDAPAPMFEDPPKCWLHKQGNFVTSYFPEGAQAGTDYGYFYLPPIDEAYGRPYLVAGDIMAMFSDRDEVRAVMEFFTMGEAVKEWLAAGGALSPHMDASLDWYGDEVEKGIAGLVADATSVRFDGSDLMPGQVGTGSFWTGMTDFFSGTADIDTVLAEIDASWPLEVAEDSIGSETAPIQILFVPSVDVDFMIASGDMIEQALHDATGLYFEVSVPNSYASTIEEMCASPKDTIGFIPAMGYALANQLCGVQPGLASEIFFGSNVFWTMYFVSRESGFQTLEDLEGTTWAYSSTTSISGYLYPQSLNANMGITVGETIEAGSNSQAVQAVYLGHADFGTAYFSYPVLPDGTWTVDMTPDIPDELVSDCGLTEEGYLYCGDYRVVDARAAFSQEAPDVVQKIRILDISPVGPLETMSFSPEFPDELKQTIIDAVTEYIGSDACAATICSESFYDWTGVGPISDENFDSTRLIMEYHGINLNNIDE